MHDYALTGGIGAGKSAVGRILRELGAHLLDADATARMLTGEPGPVMEDIIARFPAADDGGGGIDRAALAQVVFADESARADLEAIVHPAIEREMRAAAERIRAMDPGAIVIHDIPLLYEVGRAGEFTGVIVVRADRQVRSRRLQETRGMSGAEISARMAAQASDAQRAEIATWSIDNSYSVAYLRVQVRQVWRMLQARHHQFTQMAHTRN